MIMGYSDAKVCKSMINMRKYEKAFNSTFWRGGGGDGEGGALKP